MANSSKDPKGSTKHSKCSDIKGSKCSKGYTTKNSGSRGSHINIKDDRYAFLAVIDKLQLQFSLFIILILQTLYFLPGTHEWRKKFFILQGKLDKSGDLFDLSVDDGYFVFMGIIVIIFVRIFFMNVISKPFCSKILNIKGKNAKQRFAEQGWGFVQYTSSFIWGFKLFYNSNYFNNIENLYFGYPHPMSHESKAYYLIELANWASQLFTLHIEKKRKDYHQMFAHHIITILLIVLSYYHRFIRVGNVILVIMDFVDIWLCLAKVLKYCGFTKACDFVFLIFFFSWIALRHGFYNYLCYFTYSKIHHLLPTSRSPSGNGQLIVSDTLINTFLSLLGGLQLITLLWMFMILKVLYKILTGANAEDIRSDSEDDETIDSKADNDHTSESKQNEKLVETTEK